jgi:hypothetical protein
MDQACIEIYAVGCARHERTWNAAVLPQTSVGHRPAAGGFCTGASFLRVARAAVRFIDLTVADLTFAGHPRRQARASRMERQGV